MYAVLQSLFAGLTSTLRKRTSLQVEVLALRHQLAVIQRNKRRRRVPLRVWDRLVWVALLRLWPEWRKALVLVKPDKVIAWHRKGFRLYWKWKSRSRSGGRPATSEDIRKLIREMRGLHHRYERRAA